VIDRAIALAVFHDAVAACDPAARVREALAEPELAARLAGRRRYGIAIGKAALAMARGAGPVVQGVAIVPGTQPDDASGPVLDPSLPAGWQRLDGPHPEIDGRSRAALELAWWITETSAQRGDIVLALISGGASSLVEATRGDVTFGELRAITRAVIAAGAPIAELNTVRAALSFAKAGGVVIDSPATVVTLAVSDVIGDELMVIGSGPTVGPWLDAPGELVDIGAADHARRSRAAEIIGRYGLSMPRSVAAVLAGPPEELRVAREDVARVIAPMQAFSRAAAAALADRGIDAHRILAPIAGDVRTVATRLASHDHPIVAWGEPTLKLPDAPGEGGRAQQLALELARLLAGTARCAFVVGSDGVDGPAPKDRPAPAGAFVDGTTWAAIGAAGIEPMAALERCDAGKALAAVGALVVTGPTGINHADLVLFA
jgi:hydroxypyruvate reductase